MESMPIVQMASFLPMENHKQTMMDNRHQQTRYKRVNIQCEHCRSHLWVNRDISHSMFASEFQFKHSKQQRPKAPDSVHLPDLLRGRPASSDPNLPPHPAPCCSPPCPAILAQAVLPWPSTPGFPPKVALTRTSRGGTDPLGTNTLLMKRPPLKNTKVGDNCKDLECFSLTRCASSPIPCSLEMKDMLLIDPEPKVTPAVSAFGM